MRNRTVSYEKTKPVLDEQTFSKLLEAAYVIQEHNRERQELDSPNDVTLDQQGSARAGDPKEPLKLSSDSDRDGKTLPLAKIVETQHDIQLRHLGLENALQVVADRVTEIAHGCGAAIGLLDGAKVRYRAVSGVSIPAVGVTVAPNRTLCAVCLKTGKAFSSMDTNQQPGIDAQECRKRGIRSLIAVPIFQEGNVAGGLELYYASPNAFTDQDIHSCQLMAGLVTEALAREEELKWKKSLADERAAMLEALEKLQPNLAALIDSPGSKPPSAVSASGANSESYSCRKCGHQLVMEEQFCGRCGTPRASDYEAPSMQSKLASLWEMQSSETKSPAAANAASHRGDTTGEGVPAVKGFHESAMDEQLSQSFMERNRDLVEPPSSVTAKLNAPEIEAIDEQPSMPEEADVPGEELMPTEALAVRHPGHSNHWTSAASAREFLDRFITSNKQRTLLQLWNTHRGDIYLAVAVILVVCVIGWGVRSDHPVKPSKETAAAAGHRGAAPESDLSFFETLLVDLGLAEAPPAKEDKGSPGVQVWVDLRTALYYCAGSDMYGKTPQGKFTTQRQAQLDQFEPAYRKVCK